MEFELDIDSPTWRKWALGVCRRRCPKLSEEELAEATENFLNYLKVGWHIYGQMEAEGKLEEWRTSLHDDRIKTAKQELVAELCNLLEQVSLGLNRGDFPTACH